MIKWTRRAVGLLLMLGLFARLLWGALQLSTTADEPSHITSGYVALACGRVGLWTVPLRGHPLGVDSWLALPLWIAQPDMPLDSTTGWQTDYAAFLDGFWASLATQEQTVFAARVQAMFLTLLLAAVVWRWGRDVRPQPDSYSAPAGGPWAGLLALGVLAFDPTLIAHGRLATNDVGVTALGTCRTPAAMSWQKLSANSQRFLTEFSAKRGILESAVKVRLSSSRRRRNRVRGTCQTGAIARCAQSAPIRQGANGSFTQDWVG